ncbi:MAG: preprotein translocase subunit SecG [Verrucomicrobiota bacterium]|nr:preprotein translocase subunit SecG [Verrucomicrobiota bacterium]
MTIFFYFLLSLFFLLSVILCFVILIQEAKSLGLGASFGGDAGDSLFGTSTAFVLKKFTAYLSGIFLAGCLLLSVMSASLGRKSALPTPVSTEKTQEAPKET